MIDQKCFAPLRSFPKLAFPLLPAVVVVVDFCEPDVWKPGFERQGAPSELTAGSWEPGAEHQGAVSEQAANVWGPGLEYQGTVHEGGGAAWEIYP